MKKNLNKFFNPKKIAVIGASSNPKKVGGILVEKLKKFKGKTYYINIKNETINKQKSFSSIKKIKDKIDLAIIATPAHTVLKIIKECVIKKIKNILIISAGFSEIKNFSLEKKITKLTKENKINLLGPNCFGIVNPKLNLDLTFSNNSAKPGDTAFISQSGALWSYVSDLNIGFSGFVSLGNMADLNFCDWINYFSKDKSTKKIILYIEKIKDGKEFIKVCKKSKKEIIAIKSGKTKKGEAAAISHTGSIATNYKIYQGAFKQAKIKSTESFGKAFNLKINKFPIKNKNAIIITNAGGAGALITDKLIENKNNLIKPPTDILGTATAKDYKKEIDKLEKQNFSGKIIIIFTPQKIENPKEIAKEIIKSKLKKNIIAFFLGEKSILESIKILKENNVKTINKI